MGEHQFINLDDATTANAAQIPETRGDLQVFITVRDGDAVEQNVFNLGFVTLDFDAEKGIYTFIGAQPVVQNHQAPEWTQTVRRLVDPKQAVKEIEEKENANGNQ